jgi:hypothetical protein
MWISKYVSLAIVLATLGACARPAPLDASAEVARAKALYGPAAPSQVPRKAPKVQEPVHVASCAETYADRKERAQDVLRAYRARLAETAELYRWTRAHCTAKGLDVTCNATPPHGLTLEVLRARVAETEEEHGVPECRAEDAREGRATLMFSGSDAQGIDRLLAD